MLMPVAHSRPVAVVLDLGVGKARVEADDERVASCHSGEALGGAFLWEEWQVDVREFFADDVRSAAASASGRIVAFPRTAARTFASMSDSHSASSLAPWLLESPRARQPGCLWSSLTPSHDFGAREQ
jgi:hypothetical protein